MDIDFKTPLISILNSEILNRHKNTNENVSDDFVLSKLTIKSMKTNVSRLTIEVTAII